MQTSPLKDLVTLVDPASRFGFLSYLKARRRLYRALVRGLEHVSRAEFDDYLRWAAERLPGLHFGEPVDTIDLDGDAFLVSTGKRRVRTNVVVVGVGRAPYVPAFAERRLGPTVFHSSTFLTEPRDFTDKRVVVIGGGQSGAEVVRELLRGTHGRARSIVWVSCRANLFGLEDSPFVNEWFFPQHSSWYNALPPETRRRVLEDQVLASDGIRLETLESVYDLLYALEVGQHEPPLDYEIHLSTDVEAVVPGQGGERLTLRNRLTGSAGQVTADVVVACTGYDWVLPAFLDGLSPKLSLRDGWRGGIELAVRDDFSVEWDGPENCRLYVQNGAVTQHGVSDPNLSLLSWRSATILNSILGRSAYDCGAESGALTWSPRHSTAAPADFARDEEIPLSALYAAAHERVGGEAR